MVKFQITKIIYDNIKNKDNSFDESNLEDDIQYNINIKIKEKLRIGKYLFDDDTMTRVSIVKLSKLGYSINKISKILNISRMFAWKWVNYEKFQSKGFRKSKFTEEEKQFLCNKANGKTTIKDGASTRNLKKEFFQQFNKNISHQTVNNIINKGLSKPLRVVNTFSLTDLHKEKRINFAKYIKINSINTNNIFFTDECRVVLIPKTNM